MSQYLRIVTLAIILAGPIVITSCGSGTEPVPSVQDREAKTTRNYSVTYDQTYASTTIAARFLVDGKPALLDKSSTVSVEDSDLLLAGVPPRQSQAASPIYTWSLSGGSPSSAYKFKWKKPSGKILEDVVELSDAVEMSMSESTFNLRTGITIQFKKAIRKVGQRVEVMLKGKSINTGDDKTQTFSINSGERLVISPNDLTDFKAGVASVRIDSIIEKSIVGNVEDGGGSMISTVQGNAASIVLQGWN